LKYFRKLALGSIITEPTLAEEREWVKETGFFGNYFSESMKLESELRIVIRSSAERKGIYGDHGL